jgi:hypothetical protein
MAILATPEDYAAVRASLDVSLTSGDLPDATIALAVFQGAAEAEVIRRAPSWAPGGANDASVLLAAILWTASLLAERLPVVVSEQEGEYRYQRQPVDLMALAASLRARAEATLASAFDAGDKTPYRPSFFGVAHGGRGRRSRMNGPWEWQPLLQETIGE